MEVIFNSLIPIFLLILLGYTLKQIQFASDEFWKYLDKLNYFILFPSLLIYKLSTTNIEQVQNINFIYITIITLVFITLILIFLQKTKLVENSSFTSIYQGTIRFNTYIFLAIADAIYGDLGLVLCAILIAFIIPTINILVISIFTFYSQKAKISISLFIKSLFTNPLIVACLVGIGLNLLGIELFMVIQSSLSLLSSMALPLGILSVGAGLYFSNIIFSKYQIIFASFIKLVFFPLSIFLIAKLFSITSLELSILVLFASMPTAISSYSLAKELGGDIKLMSSIISVQTILSLFTILAILQFIY